MNDDTKSIHEFDFNLICEYFAQIDRQGPGCPEVTRKALSFIDGADTFSRIADIGCGTGAPTLEIARHTNATVVALDLFPLFIEHLNENALKAGLQERVIGVVGNMESLPFQKGEFDLIWSEGAIYNVGFERGLKEWREFLREGGYIAVTEVSWLTEKRPAEIEKFWHEAYPEIDTIPKKTAQMMQAGFEPRAIFVLPQTCWTDHFYTPQKLVQEAFLKKHPGNPTAEELIANQRHEAEMYAAYNAYYGYVFYIGRKI